jgi:hypothetical protein
MFQKNAAKVAKKYDIGAFFWNKERNDGKIS